MDSDIDVMAEVAQLAREDNAEYARALATEIARLEVQLEEADVARKLDDGATHGPDHWYWIVYDTLAETREELAQFNADSA